MEKSEEKSEWSLRPAVFEDLAQIVAIEASTKPGTDRWNQKAFEDYLAGHAKLPSDLWVVTDDETDEKVAGYLVLGYCGYAELWNLAVHPDYQKQGLGRRLIQAAIRSAIKKNCQKLILEVRLSNQGAIAFYEKNGFKRIAHRENFYQDQEDALTFELPLCASS